MPNFSSNKRFESTPGPTMKVIFNFEESKAIMRSLTSLNATIDVHTGSRLSIVILFAGPVGVGDGVAGVGGDRRHILVGRGHIGIADGDGGGHHGFTIFQTSDGG